MPHVILFSLGARDHLCVDGVAHLAAYARVSVESVVRSEELAEQALKPSSAALGALFAEVDAAYVAGCSRPRAAQALLDCAGVPFRDRLIEWVALPFDREALKREYGVPWYPVIDRTRCTGCGTCHGYCLFSVYSKDATGRLAGRVRVTAPLSCKTGCPACARLCPACALIFPFCHEAELNGEIAQPGNRSVDQLAATLGDDPMRVLAARRKQKQRQLIDPAKFEQAERDRVAYSGVL
ncbi:MAG: ferredoxin family protein [bacterium]